MNYMPDKHTLSYIMHLPRTALWGREAWFYRTVRSS